jgi:tuberous sclerosis protein 2
LPTKETDPLCTGKKLHIGNDYVIIVYNESGEEYNIQTVKVRAAFYFPVFVECSDCLFAHMPCTAAQVRP